jgi:hypothetical protein
MARSVRVSGRFSSREIVGCEHKVWPEGVTSSAILNMGSWRRLAASLASS